MSRKQEQVYASASGVEIPSTRSGLRLRPVGAGAAAAGGAGAPSTYEEERSQLFNGRRPATSTERMGPILTENAEFRGTVEAMAGELNSVSAAVRTLVEEAAEQRSILKHIENLTSRALTRIDAVFSISKDIRNITTRTLAGVESLVSRARSRDQTLVRELIMNEWFALATIFFLHPHLPVTIETIGPFWGYLVTAGFTKRVHGALRRGELTISASVTGGPILATYNLLMSAPHAIFLIFSLCSRWYSQRERSTAYSNVCAPTDEHDSIESLFVGSVSSMIESFRGFQRYRGAQSSPAPASGTSYTLESFTAIFTRSLTLFPRIAEQLREMDPDVFGSVPGTALLFARWAMGQLYIATSGILRSTLRVPAYLYQTREVMESEWWLLGAIIGFIYDIAGTAFSDFFGMIKQTACLSICSAKLFLDREYEGAGFMSPKVPLYGGFSLILKGITSAMGCSCPSIGGMRKTRRRRAKKASRRHRRRSLRVQRGGLADTNATTQLILLHFDLLLMYLLPSITGGKYSVDPTELSKVETDAIELFGKLIVDNKWVPLLIVDGITPLTYSPEATLPPTSCRLIKDAE